MRYIVRKGVVYGYGVNLAPRLLTLLSLSLSKINQIFDDISYSKGASLIRMLNGFLGQETFMNGVRSYLKEFAYSNATTNDLWRHLSASS